MIIGLTGKYCAGKNHIAAILEKRGLPVLDVDKLGYRVIETEKTAIVDRFGKDVLRSNGTIDRKLLGAKVFGKPEELAALEAIIHPGVNRETSAWIETQKRGCVVNAALLHRSSAIKVLDALIVVEAPVLTRLLRARRRDRLSWRALIKRFQSQKDFSFQYFIKKADIYRVKNCGYFGFRFFRFLRTRFIKKPEDRIDEILSCVGYIKA
jgi:dephospho-CoA kinase